MNSISFQKRKHNTLNMDRELEIIEEGESGASLAREYNVGKSTITE